MAEMHLKQPDFTYSACGPFTKSKGRIENLRRQEIRIISTKMILIKLVFNMICLMVIIKLKVKEHNQIKFSEIKFLKLQVLNLFYGRQVLNPCQIKNL